MYAAGRDLSVAAEAVRFRQSRRRDFQHQRRHQHNRFGKQLSFRTFQLSARQLLCYCRCDTVISIAFMHSAPVNYTILCFKNLFLRRYAYVLCNVSLNTSIACSLVCSPGMTSSLAKVNKSSSAHFLALFLKFPHFV